MNKERNNRFKIRTINSKYLLICFAVSVLTSVTACRHKGNTLTPPAALSDDSTPPPAAPVERLSKPVVNTTAGDSKVTLSWGGIPNASGYSLVWNGGAEEKLPASQLSISKTGLTNDTSYNYKLKAVGQKVGSVTYTDSEETSGTVTPASGITTYTVSFDTKGGTPASYPQQSIQHGQKIQKPDSDPTKDTYIFKGWYKDPSFGGTAWNFENDIVTEAMTLYAKWDKAFDIDVTTKTLKKYNGEKPKGKLVIPRNIYGTDIEHIGENAFKGCTDLTEVVIGDGIKTVGKNAFSGCKKLAKIELPKVMEIGDYTFANTEIESITIPEVTKIGSSAFASCKKLKAIDMPKVTELGTGVFKSSGLETVTIPSGITKITNSLFEKCENLSTVTMHNNITEIGISGFEGCNKLVSLTLSTGLLKTGSKSFKSSGIERMDFPQGFTYLGDSSFEECPGLKVVYLPSSVTDVGNDAFKNCNQSATVYAKTNEVQTKAKGKGLPDENIKVGAPPNT
ncbi:leucine-rich repeat protein [Treponema pedis]|uniref:leucine-rich repeat protein n=2 Tax=Treponema pedis TaxID=409322 RepID=UPI0004666EA6|nr:leucine-rich repeat protein [Treponema pedis]